MGDHGGDLIIKEVLRTIKVDYVARAPPDREVEDLAGKELEEALNNAKPVFEYLEEALKTGEKDVQELIQVQKKLHKIPVEVREAETIQIPSSVLTTAKGLQGTLESILYSQDWSEVKKIPVRDLVNELESIEPGRVYAVLMDGIVTQRLIDTALSKNVKLLIAARIGKIQVKPPELNYFNLQ